MLYLVREYINYRLKAKHRHGVHSPFVYKFNDECLQLKVDKTALYNYKSYFNALRRSKTTIKMDDRGAGSKKLGTTRAVSQIAKISGSRGKYAQLLYRLARYYRPKKVLELGTSLGLGTLMLHEGHPAAQITSVEGCAQTHAFLTAQHPLKNKDSVNFSSNDFLGFLEESTTIFDLIFIDGAHNLTMTLQLLDKLKAHLQDETIIVLDDIRWTPEMLRTWKEIIADSNYHLTIDLFKMGVIVPRRHQAKEHFVIRY